MSVEAMTVCDLCAGRHRAIDCRLFAALESEARQPWRLTEMKRQRIISVDTSGKPIGVVPAGRATVRV